MSNNKGRWQPDRQIEIDALASAIDAYETASDDIFLTALDADEETLRWYGAKGVGLKRLQRAAPRLVELLEEPAKNLGKSDVRRISAWALGMLGFETMKPFLEQVTESDNELLREGIADSLGFTEDLKALPYLVQLFDSNSDQTASWAALSLSKLGPQAVDTIGDLLSHQDLLCRCGYLLDALKKIGTVQALDEIESFLSAQTFDLANGLREILGLDSPSTQQ